MTNVSRAGTVSLWSLSLDQDRFHSLRLLFDVDPVQLHRFDHAPYLELSRFASAGVMAPGAFALPRALVLWLKDMLPGLELSDDAFSVPREASVTSSCTAAKENLTVAHDGGRPAAGCAVPAHRHARWPCATAPRAWSASRRARPAWTWPVTQ